MAAIGAGGTVTAALIGIPVVFISGTFGLVTAVTAGSFSFAASVGATLTAVMLPMILARTLHI